MQKGFDFLGDEVELELDKNLELKSLHFQSQSSSHQLIEECMLLANIQSAKLLEQKNSKNDENLKLGIYRVHQKPKQEKLSELFGELRMLGIWRGKAIPKTQESLHKAIIEIQNNAKKAKMQREVDKLIIKSMQQANYASHNLGHFGLGFEAYSHFTSPIRRYSDLILHRILKSKITLQEDIDYKESLPMLCDNLNTQEREIMQIEWDFQDRKFARYLSKHLGQTYQGIIINESHPILISLTDYPLMGARVVGLNGSGVKYQKALVQIIEVNLATTKVYGKVVKVYNEGFDSDNEAISQYIVAKKQNQAKIKKQRAKEEARRIASRAKRHKKQKFHKRRKRNV